MVRITVDTVICNKPLKLKAVSAWQVGECQDSQRRHDQPLHWHGGDCRIQNSHVHFIEPKWNHAGTQPVTRLSVRAAGTS